MKISYFDLLNAIRKGKAPERILIYGHEYKWDGVDYEWEGRRLADALHEWSPIAQAKVDFIEVDEEIAGYGYWIEEDDYDYGENVWRCSVCGEPYVLMEEITPKQALYNYCPCCGAKMDAERKEE